MRWPYTVLTMCETNDQVTLAAITQAFEAGRGRWIGCDWGTEFGPRKLNLRGLTSRQSQLLANALPGEESQAWREAERWLAGVERDARAAEQAAAEALRRAYAGDFDGAVAAATAACEIETRYPHKSVWQPLLHASRAAANAIP